VHRVALLLVATRVVKLLLPLTSQRFDVL
jgi:hypothetical protein